MIETSVNMNSSGYIETIRANLDETRFVICTDIVSQQCRERLGKSCHLLIWPTDWLQRMTPTLHEELTSRFELANAKVSDEEAATHDH